MPDSTHGPLITRRIALFLAGMFFAEASRTMTMVQIPVFLRELGADIRQIGLFFTISLVFPLLLRILGGWLSDSIGRLRAMVVGSVAGLLAYIAYALAPGWQLALLGPALIALTTALIFPSYKAYIADQTRPEIQGRVFGIAETTITLAWIVGPPIGGLLAEDFGYRSMFAAAVVAYAVATGVFALMLRFQQAEMVRFEGKLQLIELRSSLGGLFTLMISGGLVTWLLVTDGVRDVAFKLSFDLMPVYLREIGGLTKQSIGLLDGLFGVALAASSFPGGWLADKASERAGVVLGIGILVCSRLVFAVAGSFSGFAASWILLGLGGGLLDPAYSSLIAKGVPIRMRGVVYGLLATSLGLVSLPSPWLGSQLWELFDPRAPFVITGALGLLAIFPAWRKLVVSSVGAEPDTYEKGVVTDE